MVIDIGSEIISDQNENIEKTEKAEKKKKMMVMVLI